jgi:hypothetical protein
VEKFEARSLDMREQGIDVVDVGLWNVIGEDSHHSEVAQVQG